MAGIYFHIPFCKQACHYCDFHFSTSLANQNKLIQALISELELRRDYLNVNSVITSIYFGGGTPSLLSEKELQDLIQSVYANFKVGDNVEITLEANPDDLSKEKLLVLKNNQVNRLSIGIQSFFDEDLKWMNRAHNADESKRCLELAFSTGFDNISIDLIYGIPVSSTEKWKSNIEQALQFPITHLSAYCLTVEEGTALAHHVKSKKSAAINDEQAEEQYFILCEQLKQADFVHYEVSNFAKTGCLSRHNTAYWKNEAYLGIGPSAHSFDGKNRGSSVANNNKYLQLLAISESPFQIETLTEKEKYNEFVLTQLRTAWGISIQELESKFGQKTKNHFLNKVRQQPDEWFNQQDTIFSLNEKGFLFADRIASDLFLL